VEGLFQHVRWATVGGSLLALLMTCARNSFLPHQHGASPANGGALSRCHRAVASFTSAGTAQKVTGKPVKILCVYAERELFCPRGAGRHRELSTNIARDCTWTVVALCLASHPISLIRIGILCRREKQEAAKGGRKSEEAAASRALCGPRHLRLLSRVPPGSTRGGRRAMATSAVGCDGERS